MRKSRGEEPEEDIVAWEEVCVGEVVAVDSRSDFKARLAVQETKAEQLIMFSDNISITAPSGTDLISTKAEI